MPRVLFVNHAAVLGGGELCLLDLAQRFRTSGKVVLLSDGPLRERLAQHGVEVEVLPADPAILGVRREGSHFSVAMARAVWRTARRLAQRAADYDLLYANSQKAFVVGALAGRMARRPVVWHLQDILSREHFSRLHIGLVVRMANVFAARIVANSDATAAAFAASGGDERKVRVVYNGFDPALFAGISQADVAEVRAGLNVGNAPLVGVFARFHPWKGQHVVVEALARISGAHAVFVGEPLFGEEEYARATRERANALGLQERVHFLGFRSDVPRLMCACDIVLHPSVAPEPFGRVVVEGMLAGKPVVATAGGGVPEIVQDGLSGVLVPPGDPDALASAIAGLLHDPARRARLARAGRERAAAKFTLEASFNGMSATMAEALAR